MMNIQEKIVDISLMKPLSHTSHPEAELIRSHGGNSLAFFGLFPQNLHFMTPDGVVNYRLANKVAVVLGDPVCAPEAIEKVIQSFLDFCALYHWRVAFYQASSAYLSAYRALGLHTFKMGEEAILHPQTFTLRGSLFKFKQKFNPCWQSRYLVTSSTLALPQIALAILRLRNYSGGGVARLMPASE